MSLIGYGIEPEDFEYLQRLRSRLNGPYVLSYDERLAIGASLDVILARIGACPLLEGDVIEAPRVATDGAIGCLKHCKPRNTA